MFYKQYLSFPALFILLWINSSIILQDVHADTLYKWVDRSGQEHITDYPPPESEIKPGSDVIEEETPDRVIWAKSMLNKVLSVLDDQRRNTSSQVLLQFKQVMTGGNFSILLFIGFMLFYHLYYALCLFIFSQKVGVKTARLSWIPIVNVFPLLATAGRPWWWALPLLGLLTVFVPRISTNLYAVLCLAVLFAIDLVLFVVIWISVCRNLWIQKWLGLLVLVPVAQLILIGYLAFKKEPFIDRINRIRPALAALVCFCCIMTAVIAKLYFR